MRYQSLFEEIAKNSAKTPQILPTGTIPIQDFHKTVQVLNKKIDNAPITPIEQTHAADLAQAEKHAPALDTFIAKWKPRVPQQRSTPSSVVTNVNAATTLTQTPDPVTPAFGVQKAVTSSRAADAEQKAKQFMENRIKTDQTITGGQKMLQTYQEKAKQQRTKEISELQQKGLVTAAKNNRPKKP